MATPHQIPSGTIETDRIEGLALELRRWLTGAGAALAGEIRSYPTPIPRCDAQFNHLVERRGRLSQLVTDVDVALERPDGGAALRTVLAQLPDVPPFGDSSEELSLRDRIGAELARA
jgi:hypothetical protein